MTVLEEAERYAPSGARTVRPATLRRRVGRPQLKRDPLGSPFQLMRRKRLKHQADILCHMFRGWQLLNDYRVLTELGSGTLEIDFLNESCQHNGKLVPTLSIVRAVSAWWRNDLASNNIPLDDIQEARLNVSLDVSEQEGQRDHSITWAKSAPIFISCAIRARSVIRTNEATFASEYADRLEWPRNWAA